MYNTNVVCTYNTPEVFLETDNVTDGEKSFIRDTIYRQELLDIFEINDYNEFELNNRMLELYDKVKGFKWLQECMTKLALNFISNDKEIGFAILFSYDYLFLTHICICEFFETGKITEESIEKLKKSIY